MNHIVPTRTETTTLLVAALLLAGFLTSPAATIAPSSDTYLTEHVLLGGPSSNHSSDTILEAIGAPSFLAYPLLQFDLTSFSGQTVIGDATLNLYVDSIFGLAAPRTISIHEVLVDWAATTVTYNSFGSTAGVQFGTDVTSSIASRSVGGAGTIAQYFSWTIPGTVVQNWIDNAALNKGLLVSNQITSNSQDVVVSSIEQANAPQLVFTVPEPSTTFLGAVCLLAIVFRRNRNERSA